MSEGLSELLHRAEEIVQAAALAEDLRPIAFAKVVDHLLGASVREITQHAETMERVPQPRDLADPSLSLLAETLKMDAAAVDEIFYLDGANLGLSIPSSRLESSKKGGTRQIALLVAAGRQAAGLDDWTSTEELRKWVTHYGKFDSANFAFTISRMDNLFQLRGRGPKREVRVKAPGYEEAARLIAELTRR